MGPYGSISPEAGSQFNKKIIGKEEQIPYDKKSKEKEFAFLVEPLSNDFSVCEPVRNSIINAIDHELAFIEKTNPAQEQLEDILEDYQLGYIGAINKKTVSSRLMAIKKKLCERSFVEDVADKNGFVGAISSSDPEENSQQILQPIIKIFISAANKEFKH